jgi:hypothetical protein
MNAIVLHQKSSIFRCAGSSNSKYSNYPNQRFEQVKYLWINKMQELLDRILSFNSWFVHTNYYRQAV